MPKKINDFSLITDLTNRVIVFGNTLLNKFEAMFPSDFISFLRNTFYTKSEVDSRVASNFAGTVDTLTFNPGTPVTNIIYRANAGAGTYTNFKRLKTGTITTTSGSAALVGVGTKFLTELATGMAVYNGAGTLIGTVLSVTDDTHATFNANAALVVTAIAFNGAILVSSIDGQVDFIFNTTTGFWTKSAAVADVSKLIDTSTLVPVNTFLQPSTDFTQRPDVSQGLTPTTGQGLGGLFAIGTVDNYINYFSWFIFTTLSSDVITFSIYATGEAINQWNPTSSTTVLLYQQVFNGNFNTNPYKKIEIDLATPILLPKNKTIYFMFESASKTVTGWRHGTNQGGSAITFLEKRNPQTNYYYDSTGRTTDPPIMSLVSKFARNYAASLSSALKPKILIPDTIYAVVGQELNIWKSSVVDIANGMANYEVILTNETLAYASNADNSGIVFLDRCLRFKPVTAGQTWLIRCEIKDGNRNILVDKHFKIKTVSNTAGSGTKYCITAGDSLIEAGTITETLYNNIIADGSITPVFVGAKNTTIPGVKTEGYSGQTFGFLSANTGPFWNSGTAALDFANYATVKGIPSIDFFHIQSGINDVFSGVYGVNQTNPTGVINQAKAIINALLAAFPNCKVVVGIEPFGANGENWISSRNTNDLKRKVVELNNLLQATFYQDESGYKYHANVWTSPNFLLVDRDYGYPYTMNKVGDVADPTVTEKVFSDTVHPSPYGYKQIGGSIYSVLRRII